ncbi:hypothetical protein [Marisediminicola senii]|uniref:hypothetical protein n=1 Tax=Marisediminicola senii TaxID=2711233 RepID=UPI0013EC8EC8|nr:hypothetical protein [Marisediminicola senii]
MDDGTNLVGLAILVAILLTIRFTIPLWRPKRSPDAQAQIDREIAEDEARPFREQMLNIAPDMPRWVNVVLLAPIIVAVLFVVGGTVYFALLLFGIDPDFL